MWVNDQEVSGDREFEPLGLCQRGARPSENLLSLGQQGEVRDAIGTDKGVHHEVGPEAAGRLQRGLPNGLTTADAPNGPPRRRVQIASETRRSSSAEYGW